MPLRETEMARDSNGCGREVEDEERAEEEPPRRERPQKAKRRKEESSSDSSAESDADKAQGKKKKRKGRRSRGSRSKDTDDDTSYSDSLSESDSDSVLRRRKRKERRRKEREEEKERRRKRERRKKREKEERMKRKERKLEKDKEKKKKKKKKKEKDEGTKGAVTNSWGKYGVIKETDMWNKRPEFTAWLAEVKQVCNCKYCSRTVLLRRSSTFVSFVFMMPSLNYKNFSFLLSVQFVKLLMNSFHWPLLSLELFCSFFKPGDQLSESFEGLCVCYRFCPRVISSPKTNDKCLAHTL